MSLPLRIKNPCGQGGQGRNTPKAGGAGGEEPERWKQTAAAAEWGLFTVVIANVGVISKAAPGKKVLEPVRDIALWSILF